MSYKWWYGLSPDGIQNTLNREIQIRDDRIEELEAKLAKEIEISNQRGNHIEFVLLPQMSDLQFQLKDLQAKLAKAMEMALDECGFRDGTNSYDNWWQERRASVAALKGDK